jgi:hypothetical protein
MQRFPWFPTEVTRMAIDVAKELAALQRLGVAALRER